jgi:hypothetical protein
MNIDPGYQNVMDFSNVLPSALAFGIHVAMVFVQLSLAVFLIGSGAHGLFAGDRGTPMLLRRLGVARIAGSEARRHGAVRVGLGILLGLPLLAGASFLVSLLASSLALVLLAVVERGLLHDAGRPGRLARRTAIAFAAVVAAFIAWEREDALDLGAELLLTSQQWRSHEVAWQRANDAKAPKVGDLAPDFELRDPSGKTVVRLADFRGKRPVALVFGSYT